MRDRIAHWLANLILRTIATRKYRDSLDETYRVGVHTQLERAFAYMDEMDDDGAWQPHQRYDSIRGVVSDHQPSVTSPALGIVSLVAWDSTTIDMTIEQAEGVAPRLLAAAADARLANDRGIF